MAATRAAAPPDGSFAVVRATRPALPGLSVTTHEDQAMIRIQTLPASDPEFRSRVEEAVARAAPGVTLDGGQLTTGCEADLRRALSHVRARYPDVWIRRQDPLASIDGMETWYAFRDEAIRPTERATAGRR
jgi:hypothetical protein